MVTSAENSMNRYRCLIYRVILKPLFTPCYFKTITLTFYNFWCSSESVLIGITTHCMSGKYKIKRPTIADTTSLPAEILGLNDLRGVLTLEAWGMLSGEERKSLVGLLPGGQSGAVEPLLKGDNIFFGNPIIQWGSSVCRGQEHPEALLLKEFELKLRQSEYFKELKSYHAEYIVLGEDFKGLYESCNEDKAKFLEAIKNLE